MIYINFKIPYVDFEYKDERSTYNYLFYKFKREKKLSCGVVIAHFTEKYDDISEVPSYNFYDKLVKRVAYAECGDPIDHTKLATGGVYLKVEDVYFYGN